jgi:hypothetical protein
MFKYKTVRRRVPWCKECDCEIHGNGSIVSPYHCMCGEYEYNLETNSYEAIHK